MCCSFRIDGVVFIVCCSFRIGSVVSMVLFIVVGKSVKGGEF